VVAVADFVNILRTLAPEAQITFAADNLLPFPANLDDSGLRRILGNVPHTGLVTAVQETLAQFKKLLAENRISLDQLYS
jgi:hypothetical protein